MWAMPWQSVLASGRGYPLGGGLRVHRLRGARGVAAQGLGTCHSVCAQARAAFPAPRCKSVATAQAASE
jgi:hypothetical protein